MKKLILLSSIATSLVFTTMNCSNLISPKEADVTIPSNFSEKTTAFAFDFWKNLHKAESANENYFVSPLSLHIALGMLVNGADGQTKTEIQNVLKTNDLSLEETNKIYKDLIEGLPNVDKDVKNTIANSVWQRKDFTPESAYLTTLKDYFDAQLYVENFSDAATVGKINKWASDNTNGKIDQIIDQISPDQVLFLINALYFKGSWTNEFKKDETYKQDFNGTTATKQVDMMHQTKEMNFAQIGNYKALELPYSNEKYVMTVLLPDAGKLNDVVENLTPSAWATISKSLTKQKVMVALPKFTLKYSKKLNDILAEMGMPTAFTGNADLSKIMAPAGKLKVDFVKQDAYVAVDEQGTEAAAVTTIGVGLTSLPMYPEFICDRPFLFVISEKSSNTILFVGRIANL